MTRLSIFDPFRMVPRSDDFWNTGVDVLDYPDNKIDLYEEDDEIVLKLKAPGFEEKDIETTITGGVVSITGKKSAEEEEKDKERKYFRREISTQSFIRKVDLPVSIDPEKAEAEYDNGVLTLRMPKSEEAKAKKIEVKKK